MAINHVPLAMKVVIAVAVTIQWPNHNHRDWRRKRHSCRRPKLLVFPFDSLIMEKCNNIFHFTKHGAGHGTRPSFLSIPSCIWSFGEVSEYTTASLLLLVPKVCQEVPFGLLVPPLWLLGRTCYWIPTTSFMYHNTTRVRLLWNNCGALVLRRHVRTNPHLNGSG